MKKFNKVIFYNNYHNGDIHVGRTYVKWIVEHVMANKYVYQHRNNVKILFGKDIIWEKRVLGDNKKGIYIQGDDLYVNTWYSSCNGKYFKGCNINSLHDYFKTELKSVLNIDIDSKYNFIPEIDFTYYNISRVDQIMSKFKDKKKVFISSANALSGQSVNKIPMIEIIKILSRKFPNIKFFVSNRFNYTADNIIYNDDVIGFVNNNLNENSYISTFCDILIGRGSGPQTFSYITENINKEKLFLLVITDTLNNDINFGLDETKCEFKKTNREDINSVGSFLINEIDKYKWIT